MILTFLNGLLWLRDRRRLLLRVEFFSLRFLFLNSILCSLRKCALLSCCLSMFWQMMVVEILYL
ncbi:hypothetical protein OIU78_002016, partial [Salix suchowensis]